jgi:beta-N-acetylhexosaminidase
MAGLGVAGITGLPMLRCRNGFTGVTITDALEAARSTHSAVPASGRSPPQAPAWTSSCARPRDIAQAETVTTALANALANGQLDPTAFNAAVNRVTALRAGLF